MPLKGRMLTCSLVTAGALLVIAGCTAREADVVDLHFFQPPVMDSDAARTVASLERIQGTGQFREDGL